MSLPATIVRQEYRRQVNYREDCRQELRRINEQKLDKKAQELGISYRWMIRRLHLSGYQNILDLWEEHLYRSVDSWVAWELNPKRWEEEYDREFIKKVD